MPKTFNTTSSGFAKENERHMFEWENNSGFASNTYTTTIDGLRARHVKCNQWNSICSDKVSDTECLN